MQSLSLTEGLCIRESPSLWRGFCVVEDICVTVISTRHLRLSRSLVRFPVRTRLKLVNTCGGAFAKRVSDNLFSRAQGVEQH